MERDAIETARMAYDGWLWVGHEGFCPRCAECGSAGEPGTTNADAINWEAMADGCVDYCCNCDAFPPSDVSCREFPASHFGLAPVPMMRAQQTPGPWRVGDAGATVFGPPNGEPSPRMVAQRVRKGDSARIVACVTACEGIANPEAIRELIAAAEEATRFLRGSDAPCDVRLRAALAALRGEVTS